MEGLQIEMATMKIQMMGQLVSQMALIQNLARGQEELRALINELHQDECNQLGQTTRVEDQVIIQPPLRQEAERKPPQFALGSQAQQQPHQCQQGNRCKRNTSEKRFTEINMSLSQVLQRLLEVELILLRDPPRHPNTAFPEYNLNARCAYHSNSPGHDTDSCWALRNKIQDLVKETTLEFTQDGKMKIFR